MYFPARCSFSRSSTESDILALVRPYCETSFGYSPISCASSEMCFGFWDRAITMSLKGESFD